MDTLHRRTANETASSGVTVPYIWAITGADLFRPEQWNNFFLLVGTGAVTLTGLLFVAMSLTLKVIAGDATHRNRAIKTLTATIDFDTIARRALLPDMTVYDADTSARQSE